MRIAHLLLVCLPALPVVADEGLWPYNQFPSDAVKQKLGFDAGAAFLDRLRLASVKIGDGSGSFVSPSGLLLTNRQIAGACLNSLSSPQHDYFRDGFQAASQSEELPCKGMDASILLSIEDVTERVKAAGQSLQQRNDAITRVEKDCAAKSGHICSVVRLFSGGRYDLYAYRRYSDIRLVFAPEYTAAFFGKERDSISYLRYGLNIAFLRAYENGKPAATPDYLKWSATGVVDGDLVFAAGNPGPTGRLSTSAQLTFYRDALFPTLLTRLQPRVQQLNTFAAANEQNLRAAQSTLAALLATYKSDAGKLIGLRDDRLVTRKTNFELRIKRAVQADPKLDPKLAEDATKVWDEVAKAYTKWTPFEREYQILESPAAAGSRLFRMARQIVRGEPMDDSGEPINDAMETMMLSQYLSDLGRLDPKDAPIKAILAGATPQVAAEKMVKATRLKDAAGRSQLAANRDAAVKSGDGIIALAAALEAPAQRFRKQRDEIIGALEVSAAEKIAQYRLRIFGAADYPDGTSTPRVEFGIVKGYTDRAAVAQPYAATFSGLYYRKDNEGPWQVAQKWIDVRQDLDPVTPLDFVSTIDIGGGDYGSPVVNRAGELVGVTFDGNLESLPVTYLYSDEQARAVHVDARGIVEALDKVYKAKALLEEIGAPPPRRATSQAGRSPWFARERLAEAGR
jgi:hypothetical protein